MQSSFKGIRISGLSTVVPSGIRTIEDEVCFSGVDSSIIDRLKRDIGINIRHVVLNEECASDLCEHAAKLLLSELKYDPATIDSLIMVTQTPDYFQPASSCILHGRLGLSKNSAAFDVNLGCFGYIYGLWLSSMMISSGSCKRVLLLAGDTMSRCVSENDSAVAPLFGDAGSATLLEGEVNDNNVTFALHSDGVGFKHLIIPAGAFRKRSSPETSRVIERENGRLRSDEHLYMNGAEVFNFSIREVPLLVKEVLATSGWSMEEVDYFIFHQANKFIIKNIARILKIPIEKSPYNVFEKYGNQSSSSIPVTICENLSPIISDRPVKIVMMGFGSGFSWGACTLTLGPIACSPVVIRNY